MSVDWSATGEMLSGIGTVGGALAVMVAAFLGRNALENFRGQRQTERQMEHAESILATAYELVDALDSIRNPFSSSHELEKSKDELEEVGTLAGLDDDKAGRFAQANVFYIRSRYFDEQFKNAQKLTPYAAAFFGKGVREALEQLIRCRHTVRVYADAYARDLGHDVDFDHKIRAALWKGGLAHGPDEVTEKTDGALKFLEDALFPIIRLPDNKISEPPKKNENLDG